MRSQVRQLLAVLALTSALLTVGPPAARAAEDSRRIDINSASVAELATLPGIGEAKAKAIVEYRAADPFKTVDDLKKVKGIGDKTLDALRPDLTVGAEIGKK
jgi:competence protein ComEA